MNRGARIMNLKKLISALVLLSVLLPVAFAHGKNDIEEKDVENLNSWQEVFDLEGKKKGKYNIMITANDLGNNTTIEGPFNLWVDPESDLCIPGITNPYPGMRVVGNLNIVGTCIDDDGVDHIDLVLDGDEENPIRAEGAEFWSYYLDTTNLEEGPHTIKVTGYDINGLEGKTTTLTWQLDRRQPVTAIKDKSFSTDLPMGMLVSGNVNFNGKVTDGNGIRELHYSIDNGAHFNPVSIKKNDKEASATFTVPVDTRKFADGPAVIWFQAIDNAGSVGIYSFLYFIDNTKPDVQIISPKNDQQMNGKFSIAGFAKDKIGIRELTWTFGDLNGEIELIPGNPYWSLDFDLTGKNEKARKFIIKATDIADNVVELTYNVAINQELDKPVVTITEPVAGKQYFDNDSIYVRGFATDDDSVQSVKISYDGAEPVIQETKGDFYLFNTIASELSTGKHKVTVSAIDENGVEGYPVTVEFQTLGVAPVFGDAEISSGKETLPFVNGIAVHPESGTTFRIPLSTTTGLKEIRTSYSWGKDEPVETVIPLKNVLSYTAAIPVGSDFPKGAVIVKVSATDIYDRVSDYSGIIYILNTSEIKNDEPVVIFDDSTIEDDGKITNNFEFPATGYVLGDKAAKVTLIPSTPFAKAELNGNQIKLIPGTAIGTSEKVTVQVTTAKGKVITSRPVYFVNDNELPELTLNDFSETDAKDITETSLSISGKATCKTPLDKVTYRLFTSKIDMKAGIIGTVAPFAKGELEYADLKSDGSFKFDIDLPVNEFTDELLNGFYVVEVTAVSGAGNKTSKALAFKNIPEIEPDAKGKLPVPKAPVISWIDSEDVYVCGIYQGEMDQTFGLFERNEMNEGANSLDWSVTPADTGKTVPAKYTANKAPTLKVSFAQINKGDVQNEYMSGIPVELAYGTTDSATLVAYIDAGAVVSSATYEITGEETFGGDNRQSGSAKLLKPTDGSNRRVCEIPLKNLPSRVTKVKLTVKSGSLEKVITGYISIVRPLEASKTNDVEKIYTLASNDMTFNSEGRQYVMSTASKFYYFANLRFPIASVDLNSKTAGLKIQREGNLIILTAEKDGIYNDVSIRVKDAQGDSYDSGILNFLVDSSAPDLKIVTPELHNWMGRIVKISGTAADTIGVKTIEYSIDNGETWTEIPAAGASGTRLGVTYSRDVEIGHLEDGLIQIDVRATDTVGNVAYERTSIFKDTTPPDVSVVEPLDSDIVNGETRIVFDVKDNGWFTKAEYIAPKNTSVNSLPLSPLVSTMIGTESQPITDAMTFAFTDDAGNKTTIDKWKFLIDNESDLPVSEIHLPEENQVITRDFTISGVIYDDDGSSHIFWKIDNGEFKEYEKVDTSYSIDIPLLSLTDNEHTITVYAVDINGVKGLEVTRKFRVSLEEPKGAVLKPTIDTSVRELITISGNASDKNGIGRVQVSLDNGNSYNEAVITKSVGEHAEWSYTVDSRAIPGGTQVVFLKVTDNYGIQGLYSSLINIDNESPVLSLELPRDDSTTTGMLFFSGHSFDNVEITEMFVSIRNLEKSNSRADIRKFPITRVIGETIDITNLENGFYNIELTAKDKAGNTTNASRNIHLDKNRPAALVDLLYPLEGESKNGVFNIYGQAAGEQAITQLKLYVDDIYFDQTEITPSGFFKFNITPDMLSNGRHTYFVEAELENRQLVQSRTQTLTYSRTGPWVTIDNFTYGDFATGRPYLRGQAGYSISEDELLFSKTKEATPKEKADVAAKSVASIELSFNNGKTFIPLSTGDKWMYRIENQDLPEGYHFFLLRATMKNGETAISRVIIQIDNTDPSIRLIAPAVGGRYNQKLNVSGLSHDDVRLEDVTVTLRKGDKASYEVPSFIQGLYVDFKFWGASLFQVGAGLTFFDDVVKVQASYGQFTQAQRNLVSETLGINMTDMRYGGDILSMKILANIAEIPFSFFLGHDYDWLYAELAVGADFSYFSETNSGKPQILSAVVGQIEFPKIKLQNVKAFSSFSLYTEAALWFIPTDVSSTVTIKNRIPQIGLGFRTNIF